MINVKNMNVVLVENVHQSGVNVLKNNGFSNIRHLKISPSENDLLEIVRNVEILGVRTRTKLSKDMLKQAKNLVAIGCFCVGVDQVDLDFATEMGIPVFNAPFANTRSVAELTIGELIMLMRKVPEKNRKCHDGVWDKALPGCSEIKGKTLGIVGYGHIGMQVGVMAEALNMDVIYYDIEKKLNLCAARAVNSLDELLQISDVVTLHVPANPSTINMIGSREFALMKKGACLLNLARGKVVDIGALVEALESGHIAGAGIDVYPLEPKSQDEEFVSELRRFDNVILTPHIGGLTKEAQENIALDVSEKLSVFIVTGRTASSVNFPEINPSSNYKGTRILHIHRNVAGVMGDINRIFAEHGINIDAQYLQTGQKIGYVIMDIHNGHINDGIVVQLRNICNTIKVLVL
ncbi:MAG: phosphoglycerate dehydrogenase [Holosporaceae bacterium]|jgi:D-3-phosphoglycerate dehydrogenase|nr:phosphoglycerate dehydrogenase [Holosporaceae bacterium]